MKVHKNNIENVHKNPLQNGKITTIDDDKILFVCFFFVSVCLFRFSSANLFAHFFAFQNSGETEWLECITNTLVKFTHELDPEIQRKKTQLSFKYLMEIFRHINNSDVITHQCKRKVCKKADKPSIMTRIAKVHAV